MSKERTGNFDLYLKIGLAVSIGGKSTGELAATVATISPDKMSLELSRPSSQLPFQKGEQVWIKYWDEGASVYCWDAQVAKISGPGNRHVAISISGKGLTVQRRKSYRVRVAVPFSFTVIDAVETEFIGKQVPDSKTQNLSVDGLAFESSVPFKVGDKLEMKLHLSPSEQVSGVAWVVRSEPLERDGESVNLVALQFLQWDAAEGHQLLEFLQSQLSK
ncbi:PilZ domain-containing protein [Acidobacteria bacterium AH-259-A15]|nr:PilZ domain-containing protein [Acidobacteria bacterium AH-259-A15]